MYGDGEDEGGCDVECAVGVDVVDGVADADNGYGGDSMMGYRMAALGDAGDASDAEWWCYDVVCYRVFLGEACHRGQQLPTPACF